MKWNMEENFSMEWNMEENFSMEWKIFGMEWKKIASMEYGKIVFHSIPYPAYITTPGLALVTALSFSSFSISYSYVLI